MLSFTYCMAQSACCIAQFVPISFRLRFRKLKLYNLDHEKFRTATRGTTLSHTIMRQRPQNHFDLIKEIYIFVHWFWAVSFHCRKQPSASPPILSFAALDHVAPCYPTTSSLQGRFGLQTGPTSFVVCHSVLLVVHHFVLMTETST